eukprot:gene12510-3671_t
MADAVATVMGVLGLDRDTAANVLEMAGGNPELAVALYLDQGGDPAPAVGNTSDFHPPVPWYDVVWPERKEISPAWLEQTIEFGTEDGTRGGIVQPKNGPCGMLATIQATLWAESSEPEPWDQIYSNEDVANVMSILVNGAAGGSTAQICKWRDDVGGNIDALPTEPASVTGAILD